MSENLDRELSIDLARQILKNQMVILKVLDVTFRDNVHKGPPSHERQIENELRNAIKETDTTLKESYEL